ncbi:AAA family ATPase [Halosquirtibacter xylanolyticus]|uniref:AAA family ATPase n=1 Tax=Halosquirtibacter xylanolyticus TaxID=3374599 RepID=UPI0037488F5E|nr:AAA family ATPase [Prolixibacteraceae bacterium]
MNTTIQKLQEGIKGTIIGQEELVESLIIGLLAEGNLLLEGLPGLAKTRAVKSLSHVMDIEMNRVQFTPDLLPSDITGTEIYSPESENKFQFKKGPIFCNLVLADEINRAPAKVQSALLEAMEEHQVTVAGKTYKMDPLFMVIATQNPVEQEGTYPLPEAQLDRFMMKINIEYLTPEQEELMLKMVRGEEDNTKVEIVPISKDFVFDARKVISKIHVSEELNQYIIRLIDATRHSEKYDDSIGKYISFGSSPRGTIALDKTARCIAYIQERDYITVDDIRQVAHRVLRHRIALTYQANVDKKNADDIISEILNVVPIS